MSYCIILNGRQEDDYVLAFCARIGISCACYLYSVIEYTPSPWDSGSRIESNLSPWDSRSWIDTTLTRSIPHHPAPTNARNYGIYIQAGSTSARKSRGGGETTTLASSLQTMLKATTGKMAPIHVTNLTLTGKDQATSRTTAPPGSLIPTEQYQIIIWDKVSQGQVPSHGATQTQTESPLTGMQPRV